MISLLKTRNLICFFLNELIEEFHAVISRPRLQKHFSSEEIHQLFTIIDKYAKIVVVKSDLRICRDVKDNFLLNLAVDSQADFLVSGDKDLLVLENVQSTRILTMRQLKELLE